MSKHEKFIMTPVMSILEEMKAATTCLESGVAIYPLLDYVFQSTFIKMTGFIEQKLKCIDWELATNDYDYRRDYLKNVRDRGEYSTYDAKNGVYKKMIETLCKLKQVDDNELFSNLKGSVITFPKGKIEKLFVGTNAIFGRERDYNAFLQCECDIYRDQFLHSKNSLLELDLKDQYVNKVYRNRNRIAHNTTSYQRNLPNLTELENEDNLSRNYFFWFAILVLIDDIFTELYRQYSNCLYNCSYFDE